MCWCVTNKKYDVNRQTLMMSGVANYHGHSCKFVESKHLLHKDGYSRSWNIKLLK